MALTGTAKNVAIAVQNWIDQTNAGVQGASTQWLSTLPLENLQNNKLSKVARSTGGSALAPSLVVDIDKVFPVTLLCVPKHNLTDTAKWRIRGANATASTSSTSSNAVGTGSKTFTVGTGLSINSGDSVSIRRTSDRSKLMMGTVSSYSGSTLIVTVDNYKGSGTFTDWSISTVNWGDPASIAYDNRPVLASTTSTTSVAIAYGSLTLTLASNVYLFNGVRVRATKTGDTGTFMEGLVVSYDDQSKTLVLNIDLKGGSGTYATWTVDRLANDPNVWPTVLPWGTGVWGAFPWGGQLLLGTNYNPPAVHLITLARNDPTPIYAQFWRIDFTDSSNTAGYIDLGRLVLAYAYQPTINLQLGWSIKFVDPSRRDRSRGGQPYVDARESYRVLSIGLAGIPRDEMMANLYELDRTQGVKKPILIIVDPTDQTNLHRLTVYGSQPAPGDISNRELARFERTITIEEWL